MNYKFLTTESTRRGTNFFTVYVMYILDKKWVERMQNLEKTISKDPRLFKDIQDQ